MEDSEAVSNKYYDHELVSVLTTTKENIKKEKESIKGELSDLTSQLNQSIETVGIEVVTLKNETDENHKQISSTKISLDQLSGIIDDV